MRHDHCVNSNDLGRVLAIVQAEIRRCARQVESLRSSVDAIVEATELTSTDDEHDPEGSTIAYERAQALALLRQARLDLEQLLSVEATLRRGVEPACVECSRPIGLERLEALPSARRCIRCAS